MRMKEEEGGGRRDEGGAGGRARREEEEDFVFLSCFFRFFKFRRCLLRRRPAKAVQPWRFASYSFNRCLRYISDL